ncbi:hypothetical protein L202_01278 [Cryptococcus amylolentus CBS 6039]|uniref:Uncharacterized protein n=2 Tax=Cryptococcus amylolentus TaxID=104669 RepID=A0A1E3I314_9TREE|nr:hypothetical protein L202_01278 [Cryptococcus amylolentus CBS 6039]ODN83053.1 hypothetical protein L202_01278 [Cryptococcus amylolentus CBS 6039]ODO10669.1 hypothetical protein I350_01266 [Cryptococcus amylolentus CBS 6273]
MSSIAGKVLTKMLKTNLSKKGPDDPLYVFSVDAKGKQKRVVRDLPKGLSKRDQRALRKIRKRAHNLDKGMNLCGFRVGYTFFIGIIPGLGDAVDASLNYFLIVKPAKKLDIPDSLVHKMLFNNAISAGLGLVPVAGDIFLAAWKANSRNALLLEEYLTIRGQEYLASLQQGTSTISASEAVAHGVPPEDLRELFAPGSGMEQRDVEEGTGSRGFFGKKNKKAAAK